jgi:putative ABC transport system ATP-binding protein
MSGGRAVLELTDVAKLYPGTPPVAAVAGISLRICAGERVAVVGPSGSGKTTLLQILGTLERPSAGSVRLAGQEVSSLPDAELSAIRAYGLGFVFQQFHLLDHLDAQENVALGLLYRSGLVRERLAAAAWALDRVGLSHRVAHRPGQLSGGERQRLAIARAIAGRPPVILADEPTGNLDSVTGAEIIRLLTGLADDGTAVVVVTHDADVAAAMDRQLTMRDGRIVAVAHAVRRAVTARPC